MTPTSGIWVFRGVTLVTGSGGFCDCVCDCSHVQSRADWPSEAGSASEWGGGKPRKALGCAKRTLSVRAAAGPGASQSHLFFWSMSAAAVRQWSQVPATQLFLSQMTRRVRVNLQSSRCTVYGKQNCFIWWEISFLLFWLFNQWSDHRTLIIVSCIT